MVAESDVSALVFAAAELSPEVVVLVGEPGVVFVAVVFVAVVFVAAVFVAVDVAEPQASVDIAVAVVFLVPVSVVAAGVDSPGHPTFVASPNACSFPSSSNSVEIVGEVFVGSPTGAHTNYGLCSILSNLGLHHNKNLELCYNNASPDYNNVSDTNDLPMDATTNHSRKTGLHLYQEQRKHYWYRVILSHSGVLEM